ncbi:MAG TPA: hypothetical protein VFD33_06225 [Bacillota bacterium]|nr:hypothetical protein [Bacillota bacterium]
MDKIRKEILNQLMPFVHNCKKYTGSTNIKTFKDYLGIGGFTFLGGIVNYDKSGINYEEFERNGNLKINLTHKEVVEYGISGKYEEQVTIWEG